MAKKLKQTVWHKRKQKFISSTLLKPHHTAPESSNPEKASPVQLDRRQAFARDLLGKIRRAVRDNP